MGKTSAVKAVINRVIPNIVLVGVFMLLSTVTLSAQRSYRVEGHVLDASTNSGVAGAVVLSDMGEASATMRGGYFSLNLSEGSHTLECSHLSYSTTKQSIEVTGDCKITIALSAEGVDIEGVTVSANSPLERVASVQLGVERIELDMIMKTPSLFGQRDIIRSLTLLPGVKAESDASSGFQVRGGSSSQNLVLLDNMPIYNAGHLLGIFSIFNDNVISYASLYKGLMGAEFSGGSSSVLDIGAKGGSKEEFSGSASIGLLASSIYLEGPIWREKLSFSFGARRSYMDMFLYFFEDYRNNTLYFYDINAKLDYKVNDSNDLSLSYFRGKDNLGMTDLMAMDWSNQSFALQWFRRYSDRLTHRTSLTLSQFDSGCTFDMLEMDSAMLGFISNYGFKHNFDLQLGERHSLKFGAQLNYIDLVSAEWQTTQVHLRETFGGVEGGVWLSEQWRVSDKFTLSAGLRLGVYAPAYYKLLEDDSVGEQSVNYSLSESMDECYIYLEPRLTMNYRLTERQSLKAGYSRTTQSIQAVGTTTMSLPFDRMMMCSASIAPQVADQVSLGYIFLTQDDTYELNVEGYYKHIDNVYDYRDGMDFTSDVVMEDIILGGEGRSYGLEATLKRNIGKFTGWIGYTLSWSESRIEGISSGEWYTSSNDRRHDVSMVAIYSVSPRWDLSASWVFNTGQALTAPSAKYTIGGETYYYYAERNGYREPNYHRLDISATRTKLHKRMTSELSFGFYNLYNRKNPFMVSFFESESSSSGTVAVQTSLFGMIPSVSYTMNF